MSRALSQHSSDMEISGNTTEGTGSSQIDSELPSPTNISQSEPPSQSQPTQSTLTPSTTSGTTAVHTPYYAADAELKSFRQLWKEYMEHVHGEDYKQYGSLQMIKDTSFQYTFSYRDVPILVGKMDTVKKVAKENAAKDALGWLKNNIPYQRVNQ